MNKDWKKIIVPTVVAVLVIIFYFYVALPLLSRADLDDKTKKMVMIMPILAACLVIAFILTREGK